MRKNESVSSGIGCLVVVGLFGALVVGVYQALDRSGWIPHTAECAITARADWFVGESKTCTSGVNSLTGEITGLHCDDGPEHDVKIKYFGRVKQPEYAAVEWKCTRRESGFTCYEQSGYRQY